jgi:ATP-dependent DNA helicase DinG
VIAEGTLVPNVYVALDLETTGLDPERDAIMDVGAVKFRGEQVLESFESLVDPGRPIPYGIQQLTGITPDMVKDAPRLGNVLSRLRRLVGDLPVIGHNVSFDLGFLRRHDLLQANAAIDTFELASILLPHAGRYSLGILAGDLGITLPATHRALADARVTHALFVALLDQARRLDLTVIQAINRMAARSHWSLRPIFDDLEKQRARTVFTGTLGQQLAAKGTLSAAAGGTELLRELAVDEEPQPLRSTSAPSPLDIDELAATLEEGGLFAQNMPVFEYRRQQVEMLRHVAGAFNDSRHMMVEAGTGTGKSMAYLLPAIYWAVKNCQRVVIATHTINLQDQLIAKDIPDLQRILPVEFRAAALKGRSNYVCPHRVKQFQDSLGTRGGLDREGTSATSYLELRVLSRVLVWLNTTLTGDKQELFLPTGADNAIWRHLCSDPELCPSERCRKENCFFHRARQAAESAHLIVVNHALLLADAAAENRVLPDYRYLVVDEAHHLEDSVTRQLGFSADQRSLERILSDLSEAAGVRRSGFLSAMLRSCRDGVPQAAVGVLQDQVAAGHDAVERTGRAVREFFNTVTIFLDEHGPSDNDRYDRRLRLTPSVRHQPAWDGVEIAWDNLALGLDDVVRALLGLGQWLDSLDDSYAIDDLEDIRSQLNSYRAQVGTLRDQMGTIVMGTEQQDNGDTITWVEMAARTEVVSVHAAPLHVGHLVQRYLFDAKDSVILTSATLRTEQNFDYLRDRLGAPDLDEAAVGSPFDHEDSVLLYLPTDIPEPNQPHHQRTLEGALAELVSAIGGRTLVLFTSYSQLKNTARAMQPKLAQDEITVLEQGGGGSRAQLLDRFKTIEHCVLLGTRSFWEGIDVPGEKLSCVAIAKLPFDVPNDPICSARSETYEDGFYQYSLPNAILRFRQGFGRLIRTRTDRGVVVCCDRRVLSRQYGEAFVRSLPTCTKRAGSLADLPAMAARWIDEGRV